MLKDKKYCIYMYVNYMDSDWGWLSLINKYTKIQHIKFQCRVCFRGARGVFIQHFQHKLLHFFSLWAHVLEPKCRANTAHKIPVLRVFIQHFQHKLLHFFSLWAHVLEPKHPWLSEINAPVGYQEVAGHACEWLLLIG